MIPATRASAAVSLRSAVTVFRDLEPLISAAGRPAYEWIEATLRGASSDPGTQYHARRALCFAVTGTVMSPDTATRMLAPMSVSDIVAHLTLAAEALEREMI